MQTKTTIYLNYWFYLKKWAGLSLKTEISEYLCIYRLNTSHLIDHLPFKILCLFCSLEFFCASHPAPSPSILFGYLKLDIEKKN